MIRGLLIAWLMLLGQASWAAQSGADWLIRMTESFHSLAYDGVFVHQESGAMNSMRIRRGLIGGVEYESLEDLDGQRIAVIRANDSIICVFPDKDDYVAGYVPNEPFRRFQGLDKAKLEQAYNIKIVGKSQRIASHSAVKIKLTPKDEYRYGHEFWIDKENGFLLKHDILGLDGKLLERIQFTSINFKPDLKEQDFTPTEGAYTEQYVEVEPNSTERFWSFDWLPVGFDLVWQDARRLNDTTSMLLLSDGMSSVSVFVETTDKKRPQTLMNLGATFAGEKSVQVGDQQYLLTLVGEVPAETIQRLMAVIMPNTH